MKKTQYNPDHIPIVLELFKKNRYIVETYEIELELGISPQEVGSLMSHLTREGLIRNVGKGSSLLSKHNGTQWVLLETENSKIVKCKNCGREWPEPKSRIKRGLGKFCSRDCYFEYDVITSTEYRWIRLGNGELMKEHRYVMEQYLGRKLHPGEVVHHIDGDKRNNDINNLMLFPNHKEHYRHHLMLKAEEDMRKICGSGVYKS